MWAVLVASGMTVSVSAVGLVLLVLLQFSARGVALDNPPARSRRVEADVGVVASDHVICSDIGVDILKEGGNAIDSAIATVFCQGVANPGASGIGGGDFMLVRMANGHALAFDFRETAPLLASENMYANNVTGKTLGGLSVAVPGQVKGLYLVWKKLGTMPWKSLIQPTIRLARDGFPVPAYLASQINGTLSAILANKGLRDVFAPNGVPLVEGDLVFRKTLAETLTTIAENGSDAFYSGPIAESIAEDVQAAGGIITVQDLAEYRVRVTKPLIAETWGHTVIGFPPPSSGGVGLILFLNILAAYKNEQAIKGDLGVHHIVEAFKHTYAVRSNLADPSFVNITGVVKDMLSPDFAAELQMVISDNTTYGPEHYGGKYNPLIQQDEHGTSHLNIVDRDRNAVAMTCTINYPFGSKLLSEKTGILFNNEMDDFAIPTDSANGPPATVNFIRPKKRPLSTMSPTMLLKNGQLRAVVGGSGGIRILTAVAQVLLNFMSGYDPLTAVNLPRVHHQLLPNLLYFENYTAVRGELIEEPQTTRQFLIDRGHNLTSESTSAVSQLVVQDLSRPAKVDSRAAKNKKVFKGKLIGVSDFRKDGYPAGY